MRKNAGPLLLIAACIASSPAAASTFTTERFRCAVGGEAFTATVQMSMSSFGQRPDGRLYSTGLAPLVECPGNGLVYYKDKFDRGEIARLTPLVTSAEYQALRKTDTPYYRQYWLMQRMGEAPADVAGALLAASWWTDDNPTRKARYQREFVAAVTALPPTTPDLIWLQLRAANALRELGEHDPSDALLDQIKPSISLLSDPNQRKGAEDLAAGLRLLNAEANRASEPVILIPAEAAAWQCSEGKRPLTASERQRCDSSDMKALIDRFRAARVKED